VPVFPGIYSDGRGSSGGSGPITGGGSGNNTIIIYDDGSLVTSVATGIDFISNTVVSLSGTIAKIYIPDVQYVPYWNMGTNAISAFPTTPRNISAPSTEGTPFKIGDWTASTVHGAFNTTLLNYNSPGLISFNTNMETFRVKVLDADGFSIIKQRSLSPVTGNSDTTINNIRIVVSNWQGDYDRFKARVFVQIDISAIIPNGGRVSIYTGQDGTTTSTFTDGPFFYDANLTPPTISGLSLSQNTINSSKYLSGVRYYDLGDTFTIGITDIDNINNETWPDNVITIDGKNVGLNTYTLSVSALSNWTAAWDNVNATYASIKPINRPSYRSISSSQKIKAQAYDWSAIIPEISSSGVNYLIDTFTANSSDILEDFRDENQRTDSSWNAWNSSTALTNTDLFVNNDVLSTRYGNWSTYQPTNSANYTTGAATQWFYRGFRHSGVSHSNGIIYLNGLSEAQFSSGEMTIEISLDNINWLDCSQDWDGTLGQLPDGSGCRINSDSVNLNNSSPAIEFTLGSGPLGTTTAMTGPDGWGIYFRISMPSTSSVLLDYIEFGNWT